jgi:hypothetical protein
MPEPLEVRPHHLAGLCLVTESNLPHEWPAVLQVILNRVASPRYPDTIEEVILQRKQFSRFNPWTTVKKWSPDKVAHVYRELVRADVFHQKIDPLLLVYAQDCRVEEAGRYQERTPWRVVSDVSPDTLHYYSPVSMVPKGSAPAWAPTAKRLYTPPGIDPERFVFAEAVK